MLSWCPDVLGNDHINNQLFLEGITRVPESFLNYHPESKALMKSLFTHNFKTQAVCIYFRVWAKKYGVYVKY